MGIEFGRISGPLLAANLERGGVDLAFENDLLYLDVTNGRIGINSDSPATTLFVNSKFRTPQLVVDTTFTTPNYSITTNRIQNLIGTVYLQPDQTTNPIISGPGFGTRNYATSTNYLNISDRLIQNITTDSDINLRPPGTGKVIFNTDQLYIKGKLTATGKITLDGNITFGNNSDDNVIFDADVNSGLIPDVNITYDLGTDLKRWANIYSRRLTPNTVSIGNLSVGNTLTANGPSKLDGNVLLGNTPADTITFNGLVDSNILSANGSFGNKISSLTWNTLFLADELNVGNISISNNQITTTTDDLILKASGIGEVHLANSNVEITNDLTNTALTSLKNTINVGFLNLATVTVAGNINQTTDPGYTGTSDLYITGKFANNNITVTTPSYLSVPNVKFVNNNIQITALDTDLKFQGSGSGGVVFNKQIKIASNVISNIFDVNDINLSYKNLLTTENLELILLESVADYYLADVNNDRDYAIIFKPNSLGNTVIYSTKSLVLPIGNQSTRALSASGEIRQNSTTGLYEGYSPSGLVSFNNIYDSDRNTYITPELTPGYNDNVIRFVINTVPKVSIDSTRLYSNSLRADNVNILGNTISNNISSNDLTISPSGQGSVIINSLPLKGDIIPNNNNGAFTLASTDDGYVKFSGAGAVIFPSGDTASRLAIPEIGTYRYNSETVLQEIWDGGRWVPANGAINNVSKEDLENELNFWGFILG